MGSSLRRAVVTGIGVVCPLGPDRETSWRSVTAGTSAVVSGFAKAPVAEDDHPRAVSLALRAAEEAWRDAGGPEGGDPERVSCVVSCSKPLLGRGPGPSFLPGESVPYAVARRFRAGGTVMNLASACATGTQSVLTAAGWIQEGRADVVWAGAAESSSHPLFMAGFQQMGVLSKEGRVRPFDRARDGFVMGEGAAVFVVESLDGARARGATIHGEIAGGHFSSNAHHATRFDSDGKKMADCLDRSLRRAGLSVADLDYVNAHGTATPLNDALESKALLSLFRSGTPPVSSTKGATGHLLGATGAVELAFTLLALRDGVLPPTLHLERPVTDLLDFVPNSARSARIERAASLSFGFGGAMASVVVAR